MSRRAVVHSGSVRQFAAVVMKTLLARSAPGTYESDEPSVAGREAVAELTSALSAIEGADCGNGVLFAPDNRTAALLMSFLAERQSEARPHRAALETELARDDLAGWALEFIPAWLRGRLTKHEFVAPAAQTITVPNRFRLAILGDWGSGLYGAPVSAATIEAAEPRFDFALHLGDVYYAGTEKEVTERFLNLWPMIPEARSWALNSNHEMFSGGAGFFEKTLRDPRFSEQAGSSCFAWENAHFLFLGLDTAYEDHTIGAAQRRWIDERVRAAKHKRVVLFSHHPPFSAFGTSASKLTAVLADLLGSGRVLAWYWGHEHRCVFFERHPHWSLWGRCVGHGGYPQARDTFDQPAESINRDGSSWQHVTHAGVPSAWVLDGPNPYIDGHSEKYGPHGFVSLRIDGPVIRETVHAPDGTLLLAHTTS